MQQVRQSGADVNLEQSVRLSRCLFVKGFEASEG